MSIRLDYFTWAYGLIGDVVRGGASAVTSGLVVAGMDAKDFNYTSGRWYALMFAVFAVHAMLALMKYLETNPLPKIVTTTTTEERSEHSTIVTGTGDGQTIEERSPHTTTTTTVVEEPVKPVVPGGRE